ncbi:Astra associated protein 1 Asa1 [Clarireedia jacksonii]
MSDAPPQPSYILRGHSHPIHATAFLRNNTRLLTGDADGWIAMWSTETRRAVAVWRAHEPGCSVLGMGVWGEEGVITHGKDNKLVVWKLGLSDEEGMSTILPIDEVPAGQDERKKPWILHILEVNTMNFCSFTSYVIPRENVPDGAEAKDELLIAVPNTLTSESIDIFHLPSQHRIHNILSPSHLKPGMVMCLSLFTHPVLKSLSVLAGYEDGHACAYTLSPETQSWSPILISKSHTQPILSLAIDPSSKPGFFITSSADDRIVKYLIPSSFSFSSSSKSQTSEATEPQILKTAHSGQQSLRIRSDGKICATAGWDGRVRVYGCKKMREVAVLKWHKEGCYAVGFAALSENEAEEAGSSERKDGKGKELTRKLGGVDVKGERLRKARETHWVVAGSKDGKVSLWDIY